MTATHARQAAPSPSRSSPSVEKGLDRDPGEVQTQSVGQVGPYLLDLGAQFHRAEDHKTVYVDHLVAGTADMASELAHEFEAACVLGAGAVSGKCVPKSPSPMAPARVSMRARQSTSPSEWVLNPTDEGTSTPPPTRGKPG